MGNKINQSQIKATAPQFVRTVLTSAQIKALRATPVQIAPAPGAGKMIVPYLIIFTYHGEGATPYDVSGGGLMEIKWGTVAAPSSVLTITNNLLVSTTDDSILPNIGEPLFDYQFINTDLVNKALMLKNNGGAEYEDGTGDATVTIYYNIVSVE